MTIRQLVTVALRLFALWMCVAALQILGILTALRNMSATYANSPVLVIVLVGIFLGLGLILWWLSGPLAGGLLTGLVKTDDVRFTGYDMIVGGCVLMGLWWLKESLVPFIGLILKAFALSSQSGQSAFEWLGTPGQIAIGMEALQVVVSVIFICFPTRIATLTFLRRGLR